VTESPVLTEREAAVVTVRLNSLANRNALSEALADGLIDALRDAGADDDVKAVVLTHEGPAFCSGADLVEARDRGMGVGTERILRLLATIVRLPIPVIAQIDGATRAGGLGILAACDIAIAGPSSSFAFSEVRLALAPAIIALTVLPRISSRAASRYLLTGETFDSQTAADIGLVSAAAEHPDEQVAVICDAITRCPRQGLEQTKALVRAELARRIDEDGDAAVRLSAELFASAEARELITALLRR
jgi:enoyl-CoA hydratase